MIPKHTDEEYRSLRWELGEKEDEISELEDENDWVQSILERLEEKVKELERRLNENCK